MKIMQYGNWGSAYFALQITSYFMCICMHRSINGLTLPYGSHLSLTHSLSRLFYRPNPSPLSINQYTPVRSDKAKLNILLRSRIPGHHILLLFCGDEIKLDWYLSPNGQASVMIAISDLHYLPVQLTVRQSGIRVSALIIYYAENSEALNIA